MGQVIQLNERRALQSVAATGTKPSGATGELVSQETFAQRLEQAKLIERIRNALTGEPLLTQYNRDDQQETLTLFPRDMASISGDPKTVGYALMKMLKKAGGAEGKILLGVQEEANGGTAYTGVIRVQLTVEDMEKFRQYLSQHSKATAPQH